MRKLSSVLLFSVLALSGSSGQATGNPSGEIERAREESMNQRLKGKTVVASEQTGIKIGDKSYNFAEIRQKTIELNQLIQSVDGDVVQVSKGVLSADLSKKLKRIEKLAREIRRNVE